MGLYNGIEIWDAEKWERYKRTEAEVMRSQNEWESLNLTNNTQLIIITLNQKCFSVIIMVISWAMVHKPVLLQKCWCCIHRGTMLH